jgi:hypothetical protein
LTDESTKFSTGYLAKVKFEREENHMSEQKAKAKQKQKANGKQKGK